MGFAWVTGNNLSNLAYNVAHASLTVGGSFDAKILSVDLQRPPFSS